MAKKAYIGVDGKARKVKKMYIGIGSGPRTLPTGYTQVQYLESTGTQYIDTGFQPNQDSRAIADVQFLSAPTSHATVFGAYDDVNGWWAYYRYDDKQYRGLNGGTSQYSISYSDATARTTIELKKGALVVGETQREIPESTYSIALNAYLFAQNRNGSLKYPASIRMYSCQIYDNGVLVRDYVPCTNASGTAGLYDVVNSKFYTNAGTGTFTAGSTTLSVARRIKKAYIGIGGVARPCFGGGELEYYGAITPFGTARESHAATSNGKYALFAGGATSSSSDNPTSIEVYDASLVHSIAPTALSVRRYLLAATSVGEYSIFGGGYYNKTNVDAYNSSLTHTSCTAFTKAVCELAATTVGNYALFGGGKYVASENTAQSYVYSYNRSLTKGSPTALSKARCQLAATTVGDYAVFAGGYVEYGSSAGKYSTVDTYSASLTKSTASSLSTARLGVKATTVGNYALVAGGASGSPTATSKVVDAYNASLTRSTPTSLSVARYQLEATTVGNYAIFGGGSKTFQSSLGNSKDVDVYDESLVRTVGTPLSKARGSLAATSIGDYALFGSGSNLTTVDAYVCERPEITVNFAVFKSVGNTLYMSQAQEVQIKAKLGMKYSDLAFADTNTVEIPDSNGNTLTITLYDGYPAYKITTASGKFLTVYTPAGDTYVSTELKEGMTILTGTAFADLDYNDWTLT